MKKKVYIRRAGSSIENLAHEIRNRPHFSIRYASLLDLIVELFPHFPVHEKMPYFDITINSKKNRRFD